MKNFSVLIVDDNDDFSRVLKLMLNSLGYLNVSVATNFEDGENLFKTQKPNLVILDIHLGDGKSGIDLGRQIRQSNQELPIIFMTNNYQQEIYEQAIEVRPTTFLSKELSMLKVRQAVELSHNNFEFSQKANTTSSKPFYIISPQIFFKLGSYYKKIEIEDIEYFFYEERYANAKVGDKLYPLTCTLKDIIMMLDNYNFVRIHQSYILNVAQIDKISFSNNEVEVRGNKLPIGAKYKKELHSRLMMLN
jgi:DNA-binding LytR/AlgR family response regulator